MTPKSTVSGLLVLLEQDFGNVADGFVLYSQFRTAIQGMQRYLHQFHFLAMKADSLRVNVLMMYCSVTACTWGSSSQKQLQWMILCSFWKKSPYHQKKFRVKAKITHANMVIACGERFATQMTVQTTALRDQLMLFRLQIQTKTANNLTTCVIVQRAHASKLPIPKDKKKDGVVVAMRWEIS